MLAPLLVNERPHWELVFPDELHPAFEDFRNFLYLVWKHLGLPEPTLAQYEIAHRLQFGVDSTEESETVRGPREDSIRSFRSLGQSYITSAFAD